MQAGMIDPLGPTWCPPQSQAQALRLSDVLFIVDKEGLEGAEIFTFFLSDHQYKVEN